MYSACRAIHELNACIESRHATIQHLNSKIHSIASADSIMMVAKDNTIQALKKILSDRDNTIQELNTKLEDEIKSYNQMLTVYAKKEDRREWTTEDQSTKIEALTIHNKQLTEFIAAKDETIQNLKKTLWLNVTKKHWWNRL